MRPATSKEFQKSIELRCIERVAHARSCRALPEDEALAWPDGWLVETCGERVAVEVVAAYQRPEGEDPRRGSVWMQAWKKAEKLAKKIEESTGVPASFGAHDGEPFAVPLDGKTMIPPRMTPIHPDRWIVAAIRQKTEKRYAHNGPIVLIVHFRWPFALERSQLLSIASQAQELGSHFSEIWVANEYGDPAQKIP